jgi:hypothetical protein
VDGKSFHALGKVFTAREGVWVGAKVGLFSLATGETPQLGYADIDWLRFEPLKK